MPMTLSIPSERLVLRRFNYEDIPYLIEIASHPSVTEEIAELEATDEGARKYISLRNSFQPFEENQVFDLAIERLKDEKVIGLVTVIRKHHQKVEIGYALGIEHRGQGYATEAAKALIEYCFSEIKLHRVQAIASSGNPASWRVVERLGMKREGQLREANIKNGKWCDLLYYGILAHEWQARPENIRV
jgi:ribosomal-protein-alanine N-acetyltransferase